MRFNPWAVPLTVCATAVPLIDLHSNQLLILEFSCGSSAISSQVFKGRE